MYKNKEEKPVLAFLSHPYSKLIKISVDTSRPSNSSTSHYVLTTYSTILLTTVLIELYILISLKRESLN